MTNSADMTGPERRDVLAAESDFPTVAKIALGRIAWRERPAARVVYLADEDALVVEFSPAPARREQRYYEDLCVSFDGTDVSAMPVALCLLKFQANPESLAARTAHKLVGDAIWSRAKRQVDWPDRDESVSLGGEQLVSRLRAWEHFAKAPSLVVGVEVLPCELRFSLIGAEGKQIASEAKDLPDTEPETVVNAIADRVKEISNEYNVRGTVASHIALGVQVGGPVDRKTGTVTFLQKRDLRADPWHDVPLQEMIVQAANVPTLVLNDVEALAALEAKEFVGRSVTPCALLLLDEGIGGALLVGGEVAEWAPMEIGKTPIPEKDSIGCGCGRSNCMESEAGLLALQDAVAAATGVAVRSLEEAVEQAERSSAALEIFRQAGTVLAHGIGSAQALLRPQVWAVYGPPALLEGPSLASDAFVEALKNLEPHVRFKTHAITDIRLRPLCHEDGSRGAGLAALHHFGFLSHCHFKSSDSEILETRTA